MSADDSNEAIRLRRLVHELAEALTAAGAFLHAGRQSDDAQVRRDALDKAIAQIARADEVVPLLRRLLPPEPC